jgi:diacylglycerol kinase (ATP)
MRTFFRSFTFAWSGILDFIKNHRNAQIHFFATALVVFVGFYFGLSKLEWAAIVLCIFTVTALEAMNSAIEYLTDLVSPDYHPLAGKVKDMAAGAVLLSAIGAAIVGILIFWPYFLALFA